MSLIQDIRDKYAKWAVVAIAISLLGFILMDAFSGRSGSLGKNSTSIGKINGTEIDYIEFEKKVKSQEEYQQSQGGMRGDEGRQQILESVWNQEVNDVLMNAEFKSLGLSIGKKELNDILFGKNPPQDLVQRFKDPTTGAFDAASAQQFINQIAKSKTPAEKQQLNAYLGNLEYIRQNEKYNALLANSINVPKWLIEKQNADNSQIANISYVQIPYTSVQDSAVIVSDKEINDYVSKNKNDFKQLESRSISYVVFNAEPTSADSAEIRNQLEQLKEEFVSAPEAKNFLARYGSSIQFHDGFVGKSKMQMPEKENIYSLAKNEAYGPYVDGASYVIAKMIDSKTMPDSAKAKHILVQTFDPQSGTAILADDLGKKKIDSIELLIKNGASFDLLARTMSDDNKGPEGGSAAKGGDLGYFANGQMVKAFNDFCFEGNKGERKIVKTEFGYHYIEITDQKNFEPSYKVAYFAKPIVASQETDNAASNEANLFAGDSRDTKAFNTNFEKTLAPKGINKLVATDIKPNDYNVSGIGASRLFVREIYKASLGEVLQPFPLGDQYIVAAVTEIKEEGLQKAETAKAVVEPILRNKKKAEFITKKLGNFTSLQAIATAESQTVQTADSIRFSGAGNSVLGYENKVIGAAFASANKGKLVTQTIPGQSGVYIIQVTDLSATPVDNANIESQRNSMSAMAKQKAMYSSPAGVLRKAATIKDNRASFY